MQWNLLRGPAVAAGSLAALTLLSGCLIVVENDSVQSGSWADWDDEDDRPRIGVTTEPIGRALAAQLSVQPGHATVIADVVPGGPADRAGLRQYDVITRIDGSTEADPGDLNSAIARAGHEGRSLTLTVARAGQTLELTVTPE